MSRPELLFPVFADLETLAGIGPKSAKALAAIGLRAPRDLLFVLPHTGIDRHLRDTIQGADFPTVLTTCVTVGAHRKAARAYRVTAEDAELTFQIVFFHARGDYLKKLLPEGERRIVSGKVELFDGCLLYTSPSPRDLSTSRMPSSA